MLALFLYAVILVGIIYPTDALAGFGVKKSSPIKVVTPEDTSQCSCGSLVEYSKCCKPLHLAPDRITSPEDLIRSRYSAYANDNFEFILDTTSSTSPDYEHYLSITPTKDKAMKRWSVFLSRWCILMGYIGGSRTSDSTSKTIVSFEWKLLMSKLNRTMRSFHFAN